ncbi:extracellular solute-binding protein [Paenibacillus sp. J5C_2022]|uniref:ABC transporter substrate-binding protein n=1 Tax=Paenibacillus sp. J5C2022 TaxID=2977129 RepID=UPI0021D24F6A|nr:extracellular solute-binding protein [Paenibacillus sp. J5C2022]MCU6708535.1 extracellular solute-binding protein [Paenibacillus sp. J5C2022]
MKKTAFTFLSVILVMMMFLAACGNSSKPSNEGKQGSTGNANQEAPKETEQPKQEEVKLRVFSTFGGTDAAREAFATALDEFQKANPHIKIENDVMSANDDGFRTKVNTDMTSGNEPDLLFYFIGADANEMINAGKVVALDELLDADPEWKNGFAPAALNFARHTDGKIYSIPMTGFYEGLFVNKALFEEHGVELPTDWEKMKTAVKTFSEKGIIPLSGPFDQSHYLIEHFVLAAAGSEGQNKGLVDGIEPNWEKGLAAMKELYELGAFPQDAATIDLSMAGNYYSEGLAAMILEGSWAIGGWKDDTKANTTVLPFPAIPGGAGSGKDVVGGFGTGFYMSTATYENAQKKDAAVLLLKHLTSKDTIKAIATANGGTPAAQGVEPEGLPQAALDGFKMIGEAASISMPIDSKVTPETFNTIRANVQPILTGEKTPAEGLEAAREIELANKK